MMTISKAKIVDRMFHRLRGTVSKRVLQDAVQEILDCLSLTLAKDEAVSVHNFGTLSPYEYPEHAALDVSNGLARVTRAKQTVKFRVHCVFQQLLADRRSRFLPKNFSKPS